ncbi:MAG: hypothetical protein ABIH46_12290, partial [Chloroflexota bacterium]
MFTYRYSQRDSDQEEAELLPDELMEELSNQLMTQGSLSRAFHMMTQSGVGKEGEKKVKGLLDLLKKLRSLRQETLDKYKLSTLMDDLRRRMEQVKRAEREGIRNCLEAALQRKGEAAPREGDLSAADKEELLKMLERLSEQKQAFLDRLPDDLGGAVRELTDYEFTDDGAREQFNELLQMLQRRVAESHFRDMLEKLQGLPKEKMASLKEMVQRLNEMLEERAGGREPDFEDFVKDFGAMFGERPPSSFGELVEDMQHQLAQMQSLMASLDVESRESLQKALDSAISDDSL